MYSLEMLNYKKQIYLEDVTGRVWTERMLRSGCESVTTQIQEMRECIYCPWCDEWFNKEQWESVD